MEEGGGASPLSWVRGGGQGLRLERLSSTDMGAHRVIPAKRRDWARRSPVQNGPMGAGISLITFWTRLKERHAFATRYEKIATSFLALIHIAAAADWIKP